MQVTADRTRCVGAGQCVLTDPAVFGQDDDGMVVVLDDRPPDDATVVRVREAVHICPGRALTLDEPGT
ncbi:ferredoxin [Micromonospora inyonensis]|uniref:Ferredoxin n=1 Tax=Micromonospora inyonensis TaxID=47866 RepID=A0A1C6S9E7_9ACTN|nr:ferredoxin [Micromonospora inyonensis]SCL26014.1 ferredoxin [Micromonospora inyonensis]